MPNLEQDPERAAELCKQAQQRLAMRVSSLTEDDVRGDSRLPGWSVGHVLTHLARNADSHARRLEAALVGHDIPRYLGGDEQRTREIEDGATRPAGEIIADLIDSQDRLSVVMDECTAQRWPHSDFLGGSNYGVRACPAHRLREVEMHHVDLSLGSSARDWPEDYVAWDLAVLLRTVPERLHSPDDRRDFMAWLAGRADTFPAVELRDW